MKIRNALIALALCSASAAALADRTTATPNQPQTTKSRNDPDRMVCRTETEIGSLVHKRKTCLTVAQWRELSAETGRGVEKREALRSGGPGG